MRLFYCCNICYLPFVIVVVDCLFIVGVASTVAVFVFIIAVVGVFIVVVFIVVAISRVAFAAPEWR